jgi:hypothetical protein
MTTPAFRPMRDLYERYVAGKVSWDELKRETDRAAEAYEQNRNRASGDSGRTTAGGSDSE